MNMPNKKLSFWGQFKEFIMDLFLEEYEIKIWFHKESEITQHGLKRIMYSEPKTFLLGRLDKISQTHIKGKDLHGNPFEIKTTEPFDYNVRKKR